MEMNDMSTKQEEPQEITIDEFRTQHIQKLDEYIAKQKELKDIEKAWYSDWLDWFMYD